jgi:hypothetical protein
MSQNFLSAIRVITKRVWYDSQKDRKLVGMEGNERYFETFVSSGRVKLVSWMSLH